MSNGFIYVVDTHFIDKIEKKNPGPKCLCENGLTPPIYIEVPELSQENERLCMILPLFQLFFSFIFVLFLQYGILFWFSVLLLHVCIFTMALCTILFK